MPKIVMIKIHRKNINLPLVFTGMKVDPLHKATEELKNRVLRIMFGSWRVETGGYRELHNEFHCLYCCANIIVVVESSRMKQARNLARMKDLVW
jgi:hypothetical protein